MRVLSVADVEAKVEDTDAILVSRLADVAALAFVSVRTDTALMRVSSAAEVEAKVEDTPAIRVSSVAESAATVEDVAAGSPPTSIFVASTVVALIVPALTVVANKLPVRKLLTLTS
jgi:hypothetical protein